MSSCEEIIGRNKKHAWMAFLCEDNTTEELLATIERLDASDARDAQEQEAETAAREGRAETAAECERAAKRFDLDFKETTTHRAPSGCIVRNNQPHAFFNNQENPNGVTKNQYKSMESFASDRRDPSKCEATALKLGVPYMLVNYTHAPSGCHRTIGDGYMYFNENKYPNVHGFGVTLLHEEYQSAHEYMQSAAGKQAIADYESAKATAEVEEGNCKRAAEEVGLHYNRGRENQYLPSGCFVNAGYAIYNRNYRPKQELLQQGPRKPWRPMEDVVSEVEACAAKAEEFGLEFEVGDSPNAPSGCVVRDKDEVAVYNTDFNLERDTGGVHGPYQTTDGPYQTMEKFAEKARLDEEKRLAEEARAAAAAVDATSCTGWPCTIEGQKCPMGTPGASKSNYTCTSILDGRGGSALFWTPDGSNNCPGWDCDIQQQICNHTNGKKYMCVSKSGGGIGWKDFDQAEYHRSYKAMS